MEKTAKIGTFGNKRFPNGFRNEVSKLFRKNAVFSKRISKKGQITVFIILSIVILILFGLVYYTRTSLAKKETSTAIKKTSNTALGITPIKNYVESCLKSVSDTGVWLVGAQGGYINLSNIESTTYLGYDVPYYIDYTGTPKTNYPLLSDIENNLSRYIIVEFEKCLDSTIFEDLDFDVIKPDIDYSDSIPVNVDINIDSVVIKIDYPLIVRKKDFETKLNDFRINLPIRLGRLYNASVNAGTPLGLVADIKIEWDDEDTESYDIDAVNCDIYDPLLKQINIYGKDNDKGDTGTKIIRLVDYNPYYNNYLRSYVFQFAIKKDPIEFIGNICGGTTI